jgi:hypothetical protein
MVKALQNQPDFLEQKTALEEFFESKGHVCRMLPKMQAELNPIESYWAMMKTHLREVCDYNVAGSTCHSLCGQFQLPLSGGISRGRCGFEVCTSAKLSWGSRCRFGFESTL